MSAGKAFFDWKKKLAIFLLLLAACFLVFDLGSLYGINSALQYSDIDPYHLHELKLNLFNFFMLKLLRLLLVSGAAFLIVYWILVPYRRLLKKIKAAAGRNPQFKALLKGWRERPEQAEKLLEALLYPGKSGQNNSEADK